MRIDRVYCRLRYLAREKMLQTKAGTHPLRFCTLKPEMILLLLTKYKYCTSRPKMFQQQAAMGTPEAKTRTTARRWPVRQHEFNEGSRPNTLCPVTESLLDPLDLAAF